MGRPLLGTVHVLDDDGDEMPPGEVGQIWFESPSRFEYHNDPEKTAAAFNQEGWSSLGDIGYVDDDGFLYLTDRISHMIISGGVNIYPQEIEDLLALHPAVAEELLAHCRGNLAGYKCPRSVDFVAELPRMPTGKVDEA